MPKIASSPLLSLELVQASQPFTLLQNVLTYYVDLPAYMIQVGDWRTWHTFVTRRQPTDTPMDYEGFGHWEERIRYNERCLERVASKKKPLCLPHRGLHGLFVPVLKSGNCLGVLQTGVFLRELPTESQLLGLWKELTGRNPQPNDEAFCSYARALAACPVLDETLLKALSEMLELFGAFLTRSLDPGRVSERMAVLQKTVFARRLWHRQWVEWQAIHPQFFRFNGDSKALMAWEIEELGIARFPTTVLAVKRESTGREWADPLAALAFHREALRIAPELGETLVHPLGHYGTLLLTSADAKATPARAAAEIEGRASIFAGRMAARFGCRVWVGLGGTDLTGTALRRSYQEAVAALHLAMARDQRTLRYQDLVPATQSGSVLRRDIEALARTLLERGRSKIEDPTEAFIQAVLLGTLGRPEASRRAFMELLDRLLGALEKRQSLDAAYFERFEVDLVGNMEMAFDLNEMVARFKALLTQLLSFLERPVSGEKYYRLDTACRTLESSLDEEWTLPAAAQQFGFSATTFSREFARHAGCPFSVFLLTKRLEKARRMLTEGMTLEQVTEACGFCSVNYFIQVFKRKVGMPPRRFARTLPNPWSS